MIDVSYKQGKPGGTAKRRSRSLRCGESVSAQDESGSNVHYLQLTPRDGHDHHIPGGHLLLHLPLTLLIVFVLVATLDAQRVVRA